jgi:hypothetical protein
MCRNKSPSSPQRQFQLHPVVHDLRRNTGTVNHDRIVWLLALWPVTIIGIDLIFHLEGIEIFTETVKSRWGMPA